MEPQIVELPDGTRLEFPSDMSQADVLTATKRYYAQQAPARATGDKPPEALTETAPGEFAGERSSYSEKPRGPSRAQTLTAQDLAETNYGARAMGVEDLKASIERAVGRGAKPQDMSSLIRQSRVPEGIPGPAGALVRGATQNVAPTAGAIATGGAGAGLGALAGTAAGFGIPLLEGITIPVGTLIGGLGGAIVGAEGVNAAQNKLLESLPEKTLQDLGLSNLQRERDAREHPLARAIGEGVPGFMAGRPSTKLGETVVSGALGAGTEAYRQSQTGEMPDLARILAMGGMGALQAKGYGASNVAFGVKESPLERAARETVQPNGKPALSSAPTEMASDVGTLRNLGYNPSALDVAPPEFTRRLVENAVPASDELAARITKQRDKVLGPGETGTQALGTKAVEPVSEAPPYVTGEAVRGAEEAGQRVAGKSVTPEGELGTATAAFAERTKADAAAAKSDMNAAYDKVSENPAGATAVMSRDGGQTVGNWRRMTPQERKYYAQRFKDQGIEYKDGGDYFIRDMPGGPPEVQTREALGPATVAEFNQGLRESLQDFTRSPDEIKPVTSALADFEAPKMSGLTSTDVFGLRREMSAIERTRPGTPAADAAGKVRKQIDRMVEEMYEAGRFVGDDSAVGDMREAIGKARTYYRDYVNEPTVAALVGADAGRARGLIFGTLTDKSPGAIANVDLVRQRAGGGWEDIRKEAQAQILGDDPAKTVAKWDKWSRENPRLRDMLFTPQEQAAFPEAARGLRESEGTLGALKVGAQTLDAIPADFTTAMAGMSRKERWAAKVSLRSTLQSLLGKSGSAETVLQGLSKNTNARQNLEAILGPEETAALLKRAETLARRSQNVKSAARQAETSRGENVDPAAANAVERAARGQSFVGSAVRWLEGRNMDRAEAEAVVSDLLDPAKTDAVVARLTKLYGEGPTQVLLRRIRAATSGSTILRGLPRRLSVAAGMSAGQEEGEKPVAPEPLATEQIDPENVPSQEEADRKLLEPYGLTLEAPAAPQGDKSAPRGKRNNNPGNMRISPWVKKQPGYVGDDGEGYAVFETTQQGIDAQHRLLTNNYAGRTVNQIVEKYAPPNENTPAQRRNYKAHIAKTLGIGINDVVRPEQVEALGAAMRAFENGA